MLKLILGAACLMAVGVCAEQRKSYFAVLDAKATLAQLGDIRRWAHERGLLRTGKRTQGAIAFPNFRAISLSLTAAEVGLVRLLKGVRYVEEGSSYGRIGHSQYTPRNFGHRRWWWDRTMDDDKLVLPRSGVTFDCPDEQTDNVTYPIASMTWDPRRPSNETYRYNKKWGAGVDVYIVDSGIKCDHEEFSEGNCEWGINVADQLLDDHHGHGTHIAASIAGKTFGIAKSATVVAVRVVPESGLIDKLAVVEAIQFIVESAQSRKRRGVINMSIQFASSTVINEAVNAASLAGIVSVSAAGNDADPSCEYSPSGASSSITVGMHDAQYNPHWSSYGRCVTVYAPGWEVLSADIANTSATRFRTGTSMAAPRVAALAAVYLTTRPEATVASVKTFVVESAHRNLLSPLRSNDANLAARIRCKGSRVSRGAVPAVVDRELCPAGTDTIVLEGARNNDSFVATGNGTETLSRCWKIVCDGIVRITLTRSLADVRYYRQYINVTEIKSLSTMTNYGEIESNRDLHGDVFVSYLTLNIEGKQNIDFEYTCTPVEVSQPAPLPSPTNFRPRCIRRTEDHCNGNVQVPWRRQTQGELSYTPSGGYEHGLETCWMLQCRKWVKVEPLFVDTEQDFDTIRITDKSPYKRVLSGNYSEGEYTVLPDTMYFRRYAVIKFSSDDTVTGGGFQLKWSCDDEYVPAPIAYPAPVPFPPAAVKEPEKCPANGCGFGSCDDFIAQSFHLNDCDTLGNIFGCDCTGCGCEARPPLAPCRPATDNEIEYNFTQERCWFVACPAGQYAAFNVLRFSLQYEVMLLSFATRDGVDNLRDGSTDFRYRTIDLSGWKEQYTYIRYRAAYPSSIQSEFGFHLTWSCVDA